MSKKTSNVNVSKVGYDYAYVISQNAPDRLFGNIFNIIEALGLSEKQEEALKPLIRGEIWRVFEEAVYITQERHTAIREIYYQEKAKTNGSHPMSAI